MQNVYIKYDKISNFIDVSCENKHLDTKAIANMSIDQWANPFISNGIKWAGIYKEICNLIGEDAFTVFFSGDDASFDVLRMVMEAYPVGWKRIKGDVTIIYREDPLVTKIMINGKAADTKAIQNKSIGEWINSLQADGISWEGIFKEISKLVGNEKYTINFVGDSDSYSTLLGVCPPNVSLFLKDPKLVEALSYQKVKEEPLKSQGNVNSNVTPGKDVIYCRNCGVQMDPQAAMCVKCGFKKGTGNNFCQHCGSRVQPGQDVCLSCGCKLGGISFLDGSSSSGEGVPEDKRILCGVLALIVYLGIHNFILGEKKKGVLHILLWFPGMLLFGIPTLLNIAWSIYEGVKILNKSYVVEPNKWFA